MPYKDKEKRREYNRRHWAAYKVANKAKIDAYGATKRPSIRKAWNAANKERNAIRARAWWAANEDRRASYEAARNEKHPHRWRNADLKKKESTAGRKKPEFCEACGGKGQGKGIVFDHCHQAGHFRGWLCSNCNVVLGLVKDDRSRLLKLAAYLDRTAGGTGAQLTLSGL